MKWVLFYCGLPDSLEQVINGFCTVNKEIKKEEVIKLLKDLDSRNSFRSEETSSSVAMVTKGKKFIPVMSAMRRGTFAPSVRS